MEVVVTAVQSGMLLHALRIMQRRRVSTTEEGGMTKSLTAQSNHGSGGSGPKWHAPPRPEDHAEKNSSHHRGGGHNETP